MARTSKDNKSKFEKIKTSDNPLEFDKIIPW